MGCYNQVVKNSRDNCNREYANAFACLEQNINSPDDDGSGACSASLKKFANCSWKWKMKEKINHLFKIEEKNEKNIHDKKNWGKFS